MLPQQETGAPLHTWMCSADGGIWVADWLSWLEVRRLNKHSWMSTDPTDTSASVTFQWLLLLHSHSSVKGAAINLMGHTECVISSVVLALRLLIRIIMAIVRNCEIIHVPPLTNTRAPFHKGSRLIVRMDINRRSMANRVLRKLAINRKPFWNGGPDLSINNELKSESICDTVPGGYIHTYS